MHNPKTIVKHVVKLIQKNTLESWLMAKRNIRSYPQLITDLDEYYETISTSVRNKEIYRVFKSSFLPNKWE